MARLRFKGFTDSDEAILRQIIDRVRKGRIENPRVQSSWFDNQDYQSPEVYVGQPVSNVVAVPPLVNNSPGVANCTIHFLTLDGDLNETPLTRLVYNFTRLPLVGQFLIHRTKTGVWTGVPIGSVLSVNPVKFDANTSLNLPLWIGLSPTGVIINGVFNRHATIPANRWLHIGLVNGLPEVIAADPCEEQ